MTLRRIVPDTNTIINWLLTPRSTAARAVNRTIADNRLLVSDATLMELADVLSRAKFDPYLTIEERQEFLRLLDRVAERVEIVRTIRACRDPKDDKFLELAVQGEADIIMTGDADLLALHPFQGISILTAARFLEV